MEKNQARYEAEQRQREEQVTYVTPEYLMTRYTFLRAMAGDWRARDWITENCLDKEEIRHLVHHDTPLRKKSRKAQSIPAKKSNQGGKPKSAR
jgi:hypothetical protein